MHKKELHLLCNCNYYLAAQQQLGFQRGCEVLATKAIRLLAVLLYVIKFEEQILYI